MIANIIVDVPSRETDRPFDYIVPAEMEQWIDIGSRVGVPFGGRILQGFVIGLSHYSDVDEMKLKPISQLLDPVPVLLPDMVELSEWMCDKYCCSRIQALQVMIPSALKGKEEKLVGLSDELSDDAFTTINFSKEIVQFIENSENGIVKFETLLERFPLEHHAIKQALRDGVLMMRSSIRDRVKIKKIRYVFPPSNLSQALDTLPALKKKARKQWEVLSYLLERSEPIGLQQLMVELSVSSSTIHSLAEKGLLELKEVESSRDPYEHRQFEHTSPLPLTTLQHSVYKRIVDEIDLESGRTLLLHGVTGSGKTEVYLQSIQHCLSLGKQAIVLVPEIALTPQMVERFKGRFGSKVAVMHSRLSAGEKFDEWRKIRNGFAEVVVGARSAIFAPFERLGLIIIDEEHETSYKQEDSPKYHARDVAVRRARQHGAIVVLGSATPSLESYVAASRVSDTTSSSALLPMPARVAGQSMPAVHVVDMRDELKKGNRSMFSQPLYNGLLQRLERGEQSVLLLNRRGYSTFVMCRTCGYTAACSHCDISLTYHNKTRSLRCHYCGHTEPSPTKCPSCESEHIRFFGTGTQKVEEELAKLFPGIRVIRMDVDTTTEKHSHEKLLKQFGERKADVLLGTQMVAKGLDFPYVTLVGVVAADTSLHLPDFRSAEKTFQLLTQVAGRAGRHHLEGEVIIQTYTPEHYAIENAKHHNYDGFIAEELRLRSIMGYPPYCRLILITMSHEELTTLTATTEKFAAELRDLAQHEGLLVPLHSRLPRAMEILGPVSSPIARMKDRYRFQCVIKYRGNVDAAAIVRKAMKPFLEGNPQRRVTFSVDVDPQIIL